ncbi:MAG: translation initiation factor IF-2 subunit beta [Candidatus Aenigmatarchaeota archaeon]
MEEYEKMLKRAFESMQKKVDTKDRFEIPVAIVETSGNKTIVRNFSDILNIIRRDSAHLSKFLFKELATPGNIQGNMLVLQRRVSRDMVQKKIESYVKEFVFCKECKKPDTKMSKEEKIYFLKCEACGARYPLRSIS